MRYTGRIAQRVALLAAPGVALGLALGAGAAMASPSSGATPASGVTWHRLSVIHGWASAAHIDSTGNPAWAVKDGGVYLAGSVLQSHGANDVFAILPRPARPAHVLYLSVYTLDGTNGALNIYPDGEVAAFSSPSGNARSFTSLAAVSFPAASTAARKLTLRRGWKSSQGRWKTGDPSYHVSGGVVYLSGSLHQRGGSSGPFAVLPRAARPASRLFMTVYTYRTTTGNLEIYPNGEVWAYSGSARSFTSLAGISYPAATTARSALTLMNGWLSSQTGDHTGDPSYHVSRGVVYLSGSAHQPVNGNEQFAMLPPGTRPSHDLYIKMYANGVVGTVFILPNGDILAFSPTTSDAEAFTSLAGISYPLKS